MIKIVYMGTPQIAVNCLTKLLNFNDVKVMCVVTQPDRPCGRGKKLTPPPVKDAALTNNLTVYQTDSIKKDAELIERLKSLEPDFFITFAFGQILSQEVLDIPKFGTINLHASLLPELRGANPIQRAIYNGDKVTGITTMMTALELDAGDICMQEKIQITENMTDTELAQIISDKAPFILYPTIKNLYSGSLTSQPQDETKVTFANKFVKEDGKIDWERETAVQIHNKIRAMNSQTCAYTVLNDKIIKVVESKLMEKKSETQGIVEAVTKEGIEVGTADGVLLITKLKPEGKPVLNAYDWTNGAKLKVEDRFN